MMVVGLGNPGREYELNRHNVGFMLVDRLEDEAGVGPVMKHDTRLDADVGRVPMCGQSLILVKPTSFMNRSGYAVSQVSHYYRVKQEELLLVHDDVDLPFGSIRLRKSGGPGTHNGMRSVVEQLGTRKVPRLRIGIHGKGRKGDLSRYVLRNFDDDELQAIPEILDRCVGAVKMILNSGMDAAMNRFNRGESTEAEELEKGDPVEPRNP